MKVSRTIHVDAPGLGQRIKEARKADYRTITKLAAAADMTTANWYAIEGEAIKALPIETLHRIEKMLGVDFGRKL